MCNLTFLFMDRKYMTFYAVPLSDAKNVMKKYKSSAHHTKNILLVFTFESAFNGSPQDNTLCIRSKSINGILVEK